MGKGKRLRAIRQFGLENRVLLGEVPAVVPVVDNTCAFCWRELPITSFESVRMEWGTVGEIGSTKVEQYYRCLDRDACAWVVESRLQGRPVGAAGLAESSGCAMCDYLGLGFDDDGDLVELD